jgi:hypothetical protein
MCNNGVNATDIPTKDYAKGCCCVQAVVACTLFEPADKLPCCLGFMGLDIMLGGMLTMPGMLYGVHRDMKSPNWKNACLYTCCAPCYCTPCVMSATRSNKDSMREPLTT